MSTNYYLTTKYDDDGISVKIKKHIGKSTGCRFLFQAQPEWLSPTECLDFLNKISSRRELFYEQRVYKVPAIHNEYGELIDFAELKELVLDSEKYSVEKFINSPYNNVACKSSHYLSDGYIFSYGEFT